MSVVAVDLCCGVGGLSYGLRESGIDVRLGLDIDPSCRDPFEANVSVPFRQADLFDTPPSSLKTALSRDNATLLAACAPCQPFSDFNAKRRRDRPFGDLLLERIRQLALALAPDFVLLENVPGTRRAGALSLLTQDLERRGYWVSTQVVDTAQVGVPQSRRRVVFLAARGVLPIPGAPLEHVNAKASTVADAISDLPRLSAGEVDAVDRLHRAANLSPLNLARMRVSTPGSSWQEWPRELQLECHHRGKGTTFKDAYGRMRWDAPAPTITTKFYNYGSGRFGHPEQDRAITPREAARLQGFPDSFRFDFGQTNPSYQLLGRLIGNAVPVPLARCLGELVVTLARERGAA